MSTALRRRRWQHDDWQRRLLTRKAWVMTAIAIPCGLLIPSLPTAFRVPSLMLMLLLLGWSFRRIEAAG